MQTIYSNTSSLQFNCTDTQLQTEHSDRKQGDYVIVFPEQSNSHSRSSAVSRSSSLGATPKPQATTTTTAQNPFAHLFESLELAQ